MEGGGAGSATPLQWADFEQVDMRVGVVTDAREHGIPLSIVVVQGNPGRDSDLRDLATEVGKKEHGTVVVLSDSWVGTYSDHFSRARLEWAEDNAKYKEGKSATAGGNPIADNEQNSIAGDRGIPSLNRARSVQSRVSSVLAIGLMSLLGLGFLTWYYAKVLSRSKDAAHAAQTAAKGRAASEMAIPGIGPVTAPPLPQSCIG